MSEDREIRRNDFEGEKLEKPGNGKNSIQKEEGCKCSKGIVKKCLNKIFFDKGLTNAFRYDPGLGPRKEGGYIRFTEADGTYLARLDLVDMQNQKVNFKI